MEKKMLINSTYIPNNTLANLENRDIALWIKDLPVSQEKRDAIASFLGLPWRLIILENYDSDLISVLEKKSSTYDEMARKRGFVQIIDSDPTRIELPRRSLPIYLLNGRRANKEAQSFEDRLRQYTILETFRQSDAREVLIISSEEPPIPNGLRELWLAGYRANITVISNSSSVEKEMENWLSETKDALTATLVPSSPISVIEDFQKRYIQIYPEERKVIRMRDSRGETHKIDITTADEIERPILESFTLIEERDLLPLTPGELSQEDFVNFFKNPESSWRPTAAALPWVRDSQCKDKLQKRLVRLDRNGASENSIAYIISEPGAGGTTLARTLAWENARRGYPVLLAKQYPFVPDPLPIVNFITRVNRLFAEQILQDSTNKDSEAIELSSKEATHLDRHFETPWIIVFDTLHWQNYSTELLKFRNELSRSGRPVCLLVVTGPLQGLPIDNSVYRKLAELNHSIDLNETLQLGAHLNIFLQYYGRSKSEADWQRFYNDHTVRYIEGMAAFWVTLSFWIQNQYDFSESIQQWIYKAFIEQSDDQLIQDAILQIAAMSSERLPLAQALLPKSSGRWPVWQLIEDRESSLSRLGVTKLVVQGERHWALVHDILGRLLISALFYDYPVRDNLGFSEAINPEHLRFLILKKISGNHRLGERIHKSIGEDFAREIFKIDPDHGKVSFVEYWREVLSTLDKMPQLLRDTSRVFRHHTAISRRRIARFNNPSFYGIELSDRKELLTKAISDINYALYEIPYTSGSEPDLNLLNSLALAYFDLANVEMEFGESASKIAELKKLANEATLRAYHESPSNSFTIETYVRSLLQNAQDYPEMAMENCVTALGILYSTSNSSIENTRPPALGRLADQSVEILLRQAPKDAYARTPRNAIDVLVQAWVILAKNKSLQHGFSLKEVPIETQSQALEALSNPISRDNLQALHLRYDLTCNCFQYDYKKQIELLEPLRLSQNWISPQLQLEYAILLFQVGRSTEGDRAFRSLRQLWQTSDQFVHIPERLRWLRNIEDKKPLIVQGTTSSEFGSRAFAAVRQFSNIRVPFRPEEHSFSDFRPGLTLSGYVSFGHNGPFLRPTSTQPPAAN